jgi:hypothetical protein
MSSAAEARFRLATPATVARSVRVTALDPAGDRLVKQLAHESWTNVGFIPTSVADTRRALDEIATADLVVMVVTAGADARGVARIGQECSDRRIHTATFVIRASSTTDEALARTLAQVRPWSLMVVVANDEQYVADVLRSFR